jgi:hypothetical protein
MLDDAKMYDAAALRGMTSGSLNEDQQQELLSALSDTQEDSLDAMLETQPDYIQKAGKRIISKRILECEVNEQDYIRGIRSDRKEFRNWFSYLFSRMTEGTNSLKSFFESNSVTFITYNYDRLIEHKLMSGLRAKFHAGEDDWETIRSKVIHLHGSVGDIQPSARRVPWGLGLADDRSGQQQVLSALVWSEETIKIVHEPKPDAEEFKLAKAALAQADCVYFLGFGFGRPNVDRLDFSAVNHDAQIRYTRLGMTESEANLYVLEPLRKAKANRFQIEKLEFDALALLREYIHELVDRY